MDEIAAISAPLAAQPSAASLSPDPVGRLQALDMEVIDPKDSRKVEHLLEMFQGVFMQELMKAMRSTVPEAGLFPEDSGSDTFQSLLDQQYVAMAGGQMGGLGLTEALKFQLGLAESKSPR